MFVRFLPLKPIFSPSEVPRTMVCQGNDSCKKTGIVRYSLHPQRTQKKRGFPHRFKSCHTRKNGSFKSFLSQERPFMPSKTSGRKRWNHRGGLHCVCFPQPCLSPIKKTAVWCCWRMAQVSSCNCPSITRNSSVGEKENGLPRRGALKLGMLLQRVCSTAWLPGRRGAGTIKESKECMAPCCFDPVFKGTPVGPLFCKAKPTQSTAWHIQASLSCGTGHDSMWGGKSSFQLPMEGSLSAPRPLTGSMLAFFFLLQTHSKAIQIITWVLSPWNCTEESLERDYWGCPFAPTLVLLHSSLQGHSMFMVMVAGSNQATSLVQENCCHSILQNSLYQGKRSQGIMGKILTLEVNGLCKGHSPASLSAAQGGSTEV